MTPLAIFCPLFGTSSGSSPITRPPIERARALAEDQHDHGEADQPYDYADDQGGSDACCAERDDRQAQGAENEERPLGARPEYRRAPAPQRATLPLVPAAPDHQGEHPGGWKFRDSRGRADHAVGLACGLRVCNRRYG
jgi:hypothetical protein